MHYPRLLLAVVSLGFLAQTLPAAAAAGAVSSIALRDFNHDGKIDRAVIAFANPSRTAWAVNGLSGFGATYDGKALTIADAFMASSAADPAVLEVVFDAADPDLMVDTSAGKFEISYARVGLAKGVSDGSVELAAIATGDASAETVEIDEAGPILTSSVPAPGYDEYSPSADLTLGFSEPIVKDTISISSAAGPGGWLITTVGTGLTIQHSPYIRGTSETFGISAKDAAGNALVLNAFPNPFSFRVERTSDPTPRVDNVFAMTSPGSGSTIKAGEAAVLAWYTNMGGISTVRLSHSADAGQSWTAIANVPASQKAHVWYPPTLSSAIQLKAEGLDANGALLNLSILDTVSVSGTASASPMRAVSSVSVAQPTDTTATVSVKLDRAPTYAAMTCGAASPAISLLTKGDRPATVEASLSNLAAGRTYDCRFTLKDAAGTSLELAAPSFAGGSDSAAPQIVGPAVVDQFDAAAGTARLSWTTDEASTATVRYGSYLNYGGNAEQPLSVSHQVVMTGLVPGKMHQARITSVDVKGNAGVSKDWYFVFLRENDLVKGSGPAVYLYQGGKRYAFPDLETYRSWHGNDFSKVVLVPDTQLGTIALGGNVKMKEGVYLIKIQSDPKTYAVEPNGALRWIQTEAQARALYGAAWAARVRDVDVSLFTDYAIGAPLEGSEKPAGYRG